MRSLKKIFYTKFSELTMKEKIIGIVLFPLIYFYLIKDNMREYKGVVRGKQ